MPIVRDLLLLAHLLGFGALFGGLLVQARRAEPEVSTAVLWGAIVAFVSGVGVVAAAQHAPTPSQWGKIGTKIGVSLVLLLLVVANRRFTSIPKGLWALLLLLATAPVAISVLWH